MDEFEFELFMDKATLWLWYEALDFMTSKS